MINGDNQNLAQSDQEELAKYSSDVIKKGLELASIIKKQKQSNHDRFWVVTDYIKVENSCGAPISISESGELIAFQSSKSLNDSCITIWNIAESRTILELEGRSPFVLTPDGNYLGCLSVDHEREVIIYELKSKEVVKSQIFDLLEDEFYYDSSALSPSLTMLSLFDKDNQNLYMIDVNNNSLMFSINFGQTNIEDDCVFLGFSFDNRYLSICDTYMNNLFVLDIEKRKIIKSLDASYLSKIHLHNLGLFFFPALATLDSNTIIISLCFDWACGLIFVDDIEKDIKSLVVLDEENGGYISYISSTLDNQFIVVAYEHGIKIIRAIDKQTLLEYQNQLYRVQVSQNLTLLADIYSLHSNLQKAHQKYSEAIEINPCNFDAYNKRSTLSSTMGDYQGAMEDLQKVRQLSI